MDANQKEFARFLAETGALFFAPGLRLKDGRPTPYFVNMGMFRTGRTIDRLGRYYAGRIMAMDDNTRPDLIIGPSYKGSALAVAAAEALWREHGLDVGFDYDRKEAKTHGEATGSSNLFVTGALTAGTQTLIVDDVGTTMSTKIEIVKLIKAETARQGVSLDITGVLVAVDRQQTDAVLDAEGRVLEGVKGRDAMAAFTAETGVPVFAIVGISDVIDYLAAEKIPVRIDNVHRPLDEETVAEFRNYLGMYGARHPS